MIMRQGFFAEALTFSMAGLAFVATSQMPRAQPASTAKALPTIDFNKQIRPILSENCFQCHGPDESQRKAKLRLDTREGAFAKLRGGGFALVAGKAKQSKLLERILADDPDDRMP